MRSQPSFDCIAELQLFLRCHVAVCFAKTLHLFVSIDYVAVRVIDPSSVAASIVLWSTNVQCLWRMSILVQVLVGIGALSPT